MRFFCIEHFTPNETQVNLMALCSISDGDLSFIFFIVEPYIGGDILNKSPPISLKKGI